MQTQNGIVLLGLDLEGKHVMVGTCPRGSIKLSQHEFSLGSLLPFLHTIGHSFSILISYSSPFKVAKVMLYVAFYNYNFNKMYLILFRLEES